jgi:hypothetical protein
VHGALALEPRKDKSRSTNGTRSTVGSTTGGVMTKEVGAVTGELEGTTHHRAEGTEVAVRCVGAEGRYTVVGSTRRWAAIDCKGADGLLEQLLAPTTPPTP